MISETRPGEGEALFPLYSLGAPWAKMMKPSIFNPDEITDINFRTGRHSANPAGCIRLPERDEMLLLHYKYLSFDETHRRHRELRQGLGPSDIAQGFGHKYSWSEAALRADWDAVRSKAADVRQFVADPASYPLAKWWARYRA